MASPAPAISSGVDPLSTLGSQERAVLAVLIANAGRVVSRHELAREAGITAATERRCDSILVGIRRCLGPEAISTVRRRGWMLDRAFVPAASNLL
jgi:DNA-binding winged helix-turn-helix (wHTH) protein